MGETTVKDQISRWKRAGWIEYRRVLAGSPGWAWVTKKGLQLVDLDEIYTAREPASTRLNHLYAVAEVRLHSDEKYTWKSERRYRSEEIAKIKGKKGKTTGAIPDGIITTQKGDHIAIEAEISVKKPEEIAAKLVRLVRQSVLTGGYQHESAYSMIWFYVSSERIQRVVEAGIEVLLDEEKQRVGIVLVPTIVASKR
jgi:hypothetical protein